MTLQEYYIALRLDLKDSGAVWSEDQLNRCVRRAIADLSRFLPYEQVYELSLQFTVTDEKWTSAAAAGTYVSLANKPIKEGSETVKNAAGTTCAIDTDYTIDYSNGKITHIADKKIGNDEEACTISYTKSKIGIDLSSLTGLIRVNRVEYPLGGTPQSYASWGIWDKILTIEGSQMESQSDMSEDKHIVVQYYKEHTAPTNLLDGTWPSFLDNTVALAAGAYALLIKALEFDHQSGTDMEASRTALGNIAAIHALVDAALDKVSTHSDGANTALTAANAQLVLAATALTKINDASMPCLTDADTALDAALAQAALAATALAKVDTYLAGDTESAKALLAQIATDAAGLRTAILTALDAANSFLDEVDTTDLVGAEAVWAEEVKHILTNALPNAQDLLEFGDDSIDVSTILTDIEIALDKIATEVAAGKTYLGSGESKINTVNVGDNVPELFRDYSNVQISLGAGYRLEADERAREAGSKQRQAEIYREYAESALNMARLWDSKRKDLLSEASVRASAGVGFTREAESRISSLRAYIEQALAYARISEGFATEARERIDSANGYSTEASQRLAIADRWISEARERVSSAGGYIGEAANLLGVSASYINEAAERMGEIDRYVAESTQYIGLAASDRELANNFKLEAVERRNEAWSIWKDPSQYLGDFTMGALRQPMK